MGLDEKSGCHQNGTGEKSTWASCCFKYYYRKLAQKVGALLDNKSNFKYRVGYLLKCKRLMSPNQLTLSTLYMYRKIVMEES